MNYQVLSPIPTFITADSFKEAIKNYINMNYNRNINYMIIESMQEKQEKFLRAHLSYYMKDDRQKVKIVMTPIPNPNITLNPVIPTYTSAIENPLSPTSKVIEVVPSVEHVPVPIPRPVRPNPLISTPILSPDLQNDLPFIPINGPPILPPALSPISAVTGCSRKL